MISFMMCFHTQWEVFLKLNFIPGWNSTRFIPGWNLRENRNFFVLGLVSSQDEILSRLHVNTFKVERPKRKTKTQMKMLDGSLLFKEHSTNWTKPKNFETRRWPKKFLSFLVFHNNIKTFRQNIKRMF